MSTVVETTPDTAFHTRSRLLWEVVFFTQQNHPTNVIWASFHVTNTSFHVVNVLPRTTHAFWFVVLS